MRKTTVTLLAIALLGTASGCSKSVDRKDPQRVAEAFWNALISKDYVKARVYVLPEERESIFDAQGIEELERQSFPKQPIIRTKVDGTKGLAYIESWGTGRGIPMVFRDGRWWIGRGQ